MSYNKKRTKKHNTKEIWEGQLDSGLQKLQKEKAVMD